jgi:hypothetical protein
MSAQVATVAIVVTQRSQENEAAERLRSRPSPTTSAPSGNAERNPSQATSARKAALEQPLPTTK